MRSSAAAVLEQWFALDLVVEGGRCVGVVALDPDGIRREVRARHVVLATGGAGQLYAVTTNPSEATGDGMAMALRAGVAVGDLEFFQFHPTALHHPAMPRPLLSEALRGHGALLRDAGGERFVDELASRDVVSRAMAERMAGDGVEHLWLDATGLESFDERFPTLAAVAARPPGSTRPSTGCPSRRPRTTCRAASSPTSTGRPPWTACGRWGRWPAPACTAPTGWRRTRCSRAWCSAPGWPRPSRRATAGRSRPGSWTRSCKRPDGPIAAGAGHRLRGH